VPTLWIIRGERQEKGLVLGNAALATDHGSEITRHLATTEERRSSAAFRRNLLTR
jgi:hypothetical protein